MSYSSTWLRVELKHGHTGSGSAIRASTSFSAMPRTAIDGADRQAEAPFVPWSNADCGGHRRVARELRDALRDDAFQGPEEAGRIAGGEQFQATGVVADAGGMAGSLPDTLSPNLVGPPQSARSEPWSPVLPAPMVLVGLRMLYHTMSWSLRVISSRIRVRSSFVI